jgi:hypothetical protein
MNKLAWRKLVNGVMLGLPGCAPFHHIGFILDPDACFTSERSPSTGISSRSYRSPAKSARSGEDAIVGSLQIVGLAAALIGIPIGFWPVFIWRNARDRRFFRGPYSRIC